MKKNEKLLYVIRNHGNSQDKNNRSILGVFSSAEKAAKATRKQMKIVEQSGAKIYPEVKVCRMNLSGYFGCSAFSIQELLDDPKGFAQKAHSWSGWEYPIAQYYQF